MVSIRSKLTVKDINVILKGTNNFGTYFRISIHSTTDDAYNIKLLKENIETHSPDIVITSIRDIGWQRDWVIGIVGSNFSFEIPLERVT